MRGWLTVPTRRIVSPSSPSGYSVVFGYDFEPGDRVRDAAGAIWTVRSRTGGQVVMETAAGNTRHITIPVEVQVGSEPGNTA